ncbi:MAG: hypothetical protein R2719_13885 [Micropruina sp.]
MLAEQHHRAVLFGLRAREDERTGLAQTPARRCGAVPGRLAVRAGLDPGAHGVRRGTMLRRVAEVLGDDTRALRGLLAEYVAISDPETLPGDLLRLADATGTPRVEGRVDPGVGWATVGRGDPAGRRGGVRNARSHASAALVQVTLEARDAGAELTVTDDGRGLATGTPAAEARARPEGSRWSGARCVRSADGSTLESPPEGGTTLRVRVP